MWSIGSITPEEAGEVFDAGTRNTHSQNIEQDGSNNGNVIGSTGIQENQDCQDNGSCYNFAGMIVFIGSQSGGNVQNFGQNNYVVQEVIDVNSGNDNEVHQNVKQQNNSRYRIIMML